ncbi:hypothetical protein, partial [Gemmatimonas sp.]|uniref:hypothetical protein n=1 Tax=Gemmatimonas sp. TaxID=1962908 RepID=UPI00356B1904
MDVGKEERELSYKLLRARSSSSLFTHYPKPITQNPKPTAHGALGRLRRLWAGLWALEALG